MTGEPVSGKGVVLFFTDENPVEVWGNFTPQKKEFEVEKAVMTIADYETSNGRVVTTIDLADFLIKKFNDQLVGILEDGQ